MSMNFIEWRDYGIEQGWISFPTCYFHEGFDMTDEENVEIEEYGETCIPISRFYENIIMEDIKCQETK